MAAPVQVDDFSPLQVPLVLKTIFEGSTLEDVKEYRKVCRSWNLESSKLLRKSARLKISSGHWNSHSPEWGPEKLMALADNEMCTFTKKDCFPESVYFSYDSEYHSSFWRRFGGHIKTLVLMNARFLTLEDFQEAIFDSCPNLEKLEMASIRFYLRKAHYPWSRFPDYDFSSEDTEVACDSNDPQRGHQVENKSLKFLELYDFDESRLPRSFFKRLVNHYPNLEALRVYYYTEKSSGAFFSAFKDWLQHSDGRAEKLKDLQISLVGLKNPEKTAELLTSGNLRLEQLEFPGFQHPNHVNAAQTILQGHAATLKKLALRGVGYDEEQSAFPLPNDAVLGAVEEMKLNVGDLKSTNLWKCVPNLKKLVLWNMSLPEVVSAVGIQEFRNVALTGCVDVEFTVRHMPKNDGQAEIFHKFTALLPNVQKLKIMDEYFSTDITQVFPIVCEAFPKLVELKVISRQSEKSLDSVITGLDEELVKKINREGKTGAWKPESDQRTGGLAKLKDLKILTIQCYQGLGYSSTVFGIQRLTNLEQLHLKFRKVDEEVWKELWKPLLAQFPWKGD